MGVFEQLLTTLLIGLLEYFQGREDIKELVREQIRARGLESANAALGYKVEAARDPIGAARLRVRDGAADLELSDHDPDADTHP